MKTDIYIDEKLKFETNKQLEKKYKLIIKKNHLYIYSNDNLIKTYENINEFGIRKNHRIWNIYKTKNNSREKTLITKNITQIRNNRDYLPPLIIVIDLYSKILSDNELIEINSDYYLPYMRHFTLADYQYDANYYALGTSPDYIEDNYQPFKYSSESYTELLCTYNDKYFAHLHIEHILQYDFIVSLLTQNSLEWTKDSLSTLKCMVKGGLSTSEYIYIYIYDRIYHDEQRSLTLMSINNNPVFDSDSDGWDYYITGAFVLYYSDLPFFITIV